MPLIDAVLMELEHETKTTRRLLERLPEDKLDWRPNPKSSTLGQLALHIAAIAPRISHLASKDSVDLPGRREQPAPASKAQILEQLDRGLPEALATLGPMDDARLNATWSMVKDGKPVMSMPRWRMLRNLMLNHHYHHRGQLTVYLRELDVPLPSVYGPTADEAVG